MADWKDCIAVFNLETYVRNKLSVIVESYHLSYYHENCSYFSVFFHARGRNSDGALFQTCVGNTHETANSFHLGLVG